METTPYRLAHTPAVTPPLCSRAYPLLCFAWAFRVGERGWKWLTSTLGREAIFRNNLTSDEQGVLDYMLDWMHDVDFSRCTHPDGVCGSIVSDQCVPATPRRCQ